MSHRSARQFLIAPMIFGGLVAARTTMGGGYSDLDAPAGDSPAVGKGSLPDDIVSGTLRLAGVHEGTEVWLGESVGPGAVCLLLVIDPAQWSSACGVTPRISVGGGVEFSALPDGVTPDADLASISTNVFVRD